MSDLVALAVILLVICIMVYIIVTWYNRSHARATQIAHTRWTLEEHGNDSHWLLWAVRPHSTEQRCLAQIPWDDPNFDERVEEARINGTTRLYTLNRGLPK